MATAPRWSLTGVAASGTVAASGGTAGGRAAAVARAARATAPPSAVTPSSSAAPTGTVYRCVACYCGGPNAQFSRSSTITVTTPTGCSLSTALTGTVSVNIDCATAQVCIEESSGGCLGTPGKCYDAEFDSGNFAYMLQGCINGGVWCAPE